MSAAVIEFDTLAGVPLIAWALDAPIRHSGAKFLLVVLAAACGDGTNCAPTLEWLAERTGGHKRTAGRLLNWLEAEGWISRRRHGGPYSRVTIVLHVSKKSRAA